MNRLTALHEIDRLRDERSVLHAEELRACGEGRPEAIHRLRSEDAAIETRITGLVHELVGDALGRSTWPEKH